MDIEGLKKKASESGYGDKEVDALLNQTKILVSKPIIDYFKYLIDVELPEKDSDNKQRNELLEELNKIPVESFTGFQELTIKGFDKFRIRFQACILPATHAIDIMLPPMKTQNEEKQLLQSIFVRMDKFAEMMNVYYKQMMIAYPAFFTTLASTIKKVSFAELRINPNNRTLTFHEKYEKRLGVLLYYTNDKGEILYDEEKK